ncbi:MAG: molybdenum cofactor biosynthesis protein MoaB [Promethearchaeota archaeon]|nr:MAG: molybdenum cofactor biosynthesis protein MoaB [Candidatus Lokiarchaeota archaeon]
MKPHEEHKAKGPASVSIGVVVVSTSRYEEKLKGEHSSDKTLPIVKKTLEGFPNIHLKKTQIIADDKGQINAQFDAFMDQGNLDAIIFSGGTGLSPKDITYETLQPRIEKEIPGFGELFRSLSYEEIGSSAMLSRATGGSIKNKIIFLLPGSPNAVKLALKKLILPELKHLIYLINKKE